jgi:hypothetical protein
VQPPFVAPPTEGTSRRRWIAAGISAGVVVLLCAAGVAGVIGVGVLLYQVVRDQAEASVTQYLTALQEENFDEAYGLLCDGLQARISPQQFANDNRTPQVIDFEVGETLLQEEILVPATIEYSDGFTRSVRYVMFQDPQTGGVEVCGLVD